LRAVFIISVCTSDFSEEALSLIRLVECIVCCTVAVTSAWKEPAPGWTNSKNGPTGFLMGAAKGIVRRLPADKNLIYDYIPVDVVINELIVAAWHVGTTRYADTYLSSLLHHYLHQPAILQLYTLYCFVGGHYLAMTSEQTEDFMCTVVDNDL
jgi:hypothetical protein